MATSLPNEIPPGLAAGRTAAGGPSGALVPYPGIATRALAFAMDAAVVNLVAVAAGVGASLILSLLHIPSALKTVLVALGTVAYVLWLVGYFVVFWSTTGQTPGARMMQIKVQMGSGGAVTPTRALIRCAGVLLAALPLFLGFVPILYDARRRAFQDWLSGTVVTNSSAVSFIETRRARKREQYLALREQDLAARRLLDDTQR